MSMNRFFENLSACSAHLRGIKAEAIFPEFREGAILRFGRLFKPVHKPSVWKGARNYRKKSKKKEGEEGDDEDELASREAGKNAVVEDNEDDPFAWCNIKLDLRKPRPEEIGPNQMDSFCRPMTYEPGGNKDVGNDANGGNDKRFEI